MKTPIAFAALPVLVPALAPFLLAACAAPKEPVAVTTVYVSARPAPIGEATIDDLQRAMAAGVESSASLTQAYLERIARLDKSPSLPLNSVLQTDPDALSIAAAMDADRKAGRFHGRLHGVTVLVKDNIDTGDRMLTTAGSLAMTAAPAPRDATIVKKLRAAGAVILGKTNLSEWANIRSSKSSSGWSALGGQVGNPYGAGRNPCGSSSGTGAAIAASFATVGIGTETDGSIVCPSSVNGLVGIKPTVGLVSRAGIIPISHSQDTAGPMTRTVADAAAVLTVIAGVDPLDPATQGAHDHVERDYRAFVDANGLKGARIGVARKKVTGYNPHTDELYERAIEQMKRQGAVIVDNADFGNLGDYDEEELEVLLYELKADLNAYLATRTGLPVRSLQDVIAFNEANKAAEMPWFGQDLFVKAQAKGPLTDEAYRKAADKARKLAREGIDDVLKKNNLDAIIAPTGSPAWLTDHVNGDSFQGSSSSPAAVAGYPTITVPMGMAHGLPVGLTFVGTAWSEGKLIRLASGFEAGARLRVPPVLR